MALSGKKESELYEAVHESVMSARMKIWKMKDQKNISISEIDDIMSDLSVAAPKAAIEIFRPKQ